ncbi:EAL domain-containing protein [Caballeronia sp. 15711]|uniref:EAL domain-containing protein n=1 Tax=Caballeronia sp. 15711 TaxID=3391029 RepID=UPI0039E45DA9
MLMRRLIATLAAESGVKHATIERAVHFLSRAKLLRAARRGLRRGEFYVVYQPIFDVNTSACVGVEALVRWRNDTFGGAGPDHFIVHLERTSLIGPLTRFVLRQASIDIRQTPGVDHWHISVNICARHLASRGFVDDIRQAAGTMLNRTVLEITERSCAARTPQVRAALHTLKQAGVLLSLDDFGTGFSNLDLLGDFNFDLVKVDRRYLVTDEENRPAFLKAVANLVHSLGAKVVVEGVETAEQHRSVRQSGIDLAQGYRYGMPMTIKQLREFASAETMQRQLVATQQNGVPVVPENTASAADERYRESVIGATRLLESGAEEVLDRITRIASRALRMPIAAVSVLHEQTQTFKASVGLDIQSTPRHIAFCQRALDLDRLLVVRDARAHPDFTANPLVTGAPRIRFYAGIPLRTLSGIAIGTLCVMDRVPRRFSFEQREMLMDLGRMIEHELRLRELEEPSGLPIQQIIERLQNQHALYFDTFYQAPVAIAHIGRDWTWRRMNAACVKLFGNSRESLTGTTLPELLDETERNALQHALTAFDEPYHAGLTMVEVTLRLPDGRKKGARVQIALQRDTQSPDDELLFVFHDAHAEQQEREAGLHQAAQSASDDLRNSYGQLADTAQQLVSRRFDLRAFADNLPVLVAYVDSERRFRFANSTYRDWFGLDPEAILGRTVREVLDPEYVATIEPYVQRALAGERVEYEISATINGTRRVLRGLLVPTHIQGRSAGGYYLLVQDVTERQALVDRLRDLAFHDALTGLHNRRAFLSKLDTALRECRDCLAAVMFIDLDGFKAVNDTYGHLSGDRVLVEVAARIRHCVRDSDVVARLAGDEFTVLLTGSGSDKHAIAGIAQVILQTIGQPMRIDGRAIQLSASIGVLVPESSATLSSEVLLKAADDAMYRAKQAGKGRFVMQEISALDAPLAAASSGR